MRRTYLPALLGLALSAGPVFGEAGRTAAPFLQRAMGARAAGMGGTFTAVVGDIESLQYNPGALGTLEKKTVTSSYLKGLGGATHGYFAYAHPTTLGTFSGSVLYFNAGKIALNLSDGTRESVTAEENTAAMLTYARHLAHGLHAGVTYRYVKLRLADTAEATTSQTDFGILCRSPLKGLSLGGAYQFLGPDIKFESVGDPPPKTVRVGAAYRWPDLDPRTIDPSVDLNAFDMTVALDNVSVLQEDNSQRLGLELGLTPPATTRIALRTGWIFGRSTEGFTFGIGFRSGMFRFDYAFGNAPELGHLQHFSLSAQF